MRKTDIQDVKILFYKLKKSFTTAYGKTLLPKLADFHEDGTKLLVFIVQNTQSTTSAAMRNAQSDLNKLSFKEVRYDIDRLTLSALVCWRFFGDSAFHKKLSPERIPMSVDLEDSIVDKQPQSSQADHFLFACDRAC